MSSVDECYGNFSMMSREIESSIKMASSVDAHYGNSFRKSHEIEGSIKMSSVDECYGNSFRKSREKFDEFRQKGRYCDVTIRVGETTKTCHRAVLASISEFFDTMFYSKFRENYNEEIVLPEVDPVAFESILNFAYLEQKLNFFVPGNNVFDILKACDFLRVFDLVELCISHIIKHMSSIENLCGIFVFACVSNHPTLRDALSTYIIEKFNKFSSNEDFLLLPYEQLNMILEKRQLLNFKSVVPSSSNDEDLLLDALIRWTLYSCPERKKYFLDKLITIVNFERISNNYLKFISNHHQMNLYGCSDFKSCLTAFIKSSGSDDTLPSVAYMSSHSKNLALYVYRHVGLKYFNFHTEKYVTYEKRTKFYSISKYESKWSFIQLEDKAISILADVEHDKLLLALDEPSYLYCLNLATKPRDVSFSSYSSVTMDEEETLTVPPFCGRSSKMCGFQNNHIYLYNDYDAHRIPSFSSRVTFSADKYPTILNYQCEIGEWFTVPEMKTRTSRPGFVADDKLVYLIGGVLDSKERSCSRFVQAYDPRVSKWLELTKIDTSTSSYLFNGKCCYLNGKIYALNFTNNNIDVFDPVAGEWEVLTNFNEHQNFEMKQMVPFENQLWFFCYHRKRGVNLQTIIFDPTTKIWLPCKSIDDLIRSEKEMMIYHANYLSDYPFMDKKVDILNAFVFKPL